MVGKLIYLTHTQPDIAHAVGVVSQFMHLPQIHHMEAVMRIIRYLKKTADHGVMFKRHGHLKTQIYTYASWAGEKGDRKSTSGFFTLVGGNLVAWRSKKQEVISLSSAESEFRGIAKGVIEALWIKKLLIEIGFPPNEAIQILCDNEAAIAISENPVQHDRTKHVEIDRHFIREKLDDEIISLPSIRSEDQLADILTKLGVVCFLH
ncbi:secreted RxLR effector protein 161-like [Rutidosis leptorrhynchoides]|uniref:secreted RxLR effector protein 161-like n=1 Tax=Rutidosis leptorrhynchoides TaxID=125765 RepID=UPI003A996641